MLRLDRAEEAALLAEARAPDRALRPRRTMPMRRPPRWRWASSASSRSRARWPASRPLLLLDEPAAGLRHLEKQALAELLSQLRAEGLGILVVEHDMEFVMNLADRITVLEFGTVIAEGTPAEVQAEPRGAGRLPGRQRRS